MKNLIIYVILISILFNCENNHKKSSDELLYLKNEIVKNGNSSAFIELATYNENMKIYGETLPYCLIMINKHKYKRSYNKIAEEIISINNNGNYDIKYLEKLNDGDKNFVMYYLNLGLKENNIECVYLCEKIYRNGWGVRRNLIVADSLNKIYISRIKYKK